MLREQCWRNFCYSFYVVFFFLISIVNAKVATIDFDGDETVTYKTFDDFLNKIQADTNAYVDTVLFIGDNQHTYSVTANLEKDLGKRITFRGNDSNPDKFPILNHTANSLYGFFTKNDIHFEQIIFTGTTFFDNGQNSEDLIFDNCVVKDCSSEFFNLQGDSPRKIFFRNCLFANNTDTIFRLNFWGSPNLQMINCTFDNNKAIFSTDEDASSGFSIVNCIFSNTGALPGNNLKSRTSYSYIQEANTGYGEGCVQRLADDSIYVKTAPRTLPSHWKIKAESGAYKIGLSTVANGLKTDIAGVDRGTIYDAGCWKLNNIIQITQKPQSDTVIEDSTVTFKVIASGEGTTALVYAWYRLGSETSLSETSILSFAAKADFDNTNYYCLIKNGDNTISTDTVKLRIYQKPVLKNDIAETFTLKTGDSVQISVSADQLGLSYHWFLKGVEVTADTLSSVFKIKSVRKDEHNNAVVYCVVKNPAGDAKSASDTLKISENAPRITTEPSNLTVYDGEDASFSVKAEGSIPLSLEYNWYQIKMGETTPKKVGTNNPTLALTMVSKDTLNGAIYYCVVKCLGDSTRSHNATLTILENGNPKIIDYTPKLETRVGQSGSLNVIVQGLDCSFKWYKDGVAIPNIDTNVYTISNAAIEHSGTYYCIITNSKGSDTTPNIIVKVRNAGEVYNSINLKGTFIDRTKIKITITNFANLPTTPDVQYVDSIGIWFQESKFPSSPDRNSANLFKIPLSVMLAKAGTIDSYDTNVTIVMGDKPCDTLYFIATPFWKNRDTLPAFNTTSGAKVYTCASDILSNPLKFTITQPVVGKANLKITGVENLNPKEISSVITYYGKAAPYNETIIPIDELGLPSNTFSKSFEDKLFSDKEENINWGVYVRGIQGNYSSKNEEKVTVGYPIPANDVLLQLDSAIGIGPTKIPLKWISAVAADSFRIWYGKEPLPLVRSFDSLSKGHKYITIGGSKKSAVITELTLNTTYYFGLQIKKNIWSSITQNSSASFKTNSSNLEDIKNTLNIKQIDFIESRNIISLQYTIDTAGLGKKYFEIDYTIGKNGFVTEKQGDNNPKGIPLTASPKEVYTYEIDLGEDLDFDVTYYIALWVRGSIPPDQITDWATPTDSSKKTVLIPSAKWMSIVYFPKKDTITAFENSVIMWKDSTWNKPNESYDDTLNFIILPQEKVPTGFIPVSKSVQFNNPLITPALHFGLRYDSIPNGYNKSDINLYEFNIDKGIWNLVSPKDHNNSDSIVSVFIKPIEHKNPLVLMIDTFRPTVEITKDNGDSILTQNNDVIYKIKIRDNTTNVKTIFMYGTGADTLKTETDIIGDDPKDTLSLYRINSEYVNINSGVRALLIVTDGHFTDTINLSRMVYNPNIIIKTEEMKWYPLNMHYELNSVNITQIFDSLAGPEKKYDNTKFRIFKWVSETNNKVSWLEYGISKDKDDQFNLYPGNLLWIKTREAATLVFKNARTLSLKKNYTIKLPAKSWTDFSVPFEFPLRLDDVIETTGGKADSLVFRQWKMNLKSYTSENIRSSINYDPETEVSGENNNVYTVYNPTNQEIELKFPPLPSVLSKLSLQKKHVTADWSVIVTGHSKDEELNPLYIGCFSNGVNKTLIPSAPSFGNLNMSIIEDNNSYGIHISGGKSDGFAYRIDFNNSEDAKRTIHCQIVEKISSGFKIQVFNPVKGTIEDGVSGFNVDIDGGSNTERWLLVGDDAFISKFIQTNIGLKFDLLKIFPNPFKGVLHIKFTVPLSGVNFVNCQLFDALGRRIWNFKINEIHPGMNSFTWQPGQKSIRKLASGTYFLTLTAKNDKGKEIGSKQAKIMYLSH